MTLTATSRWRRLGVLLLTIVLIAAGTAPASPVAASEPIADPYADVRPELRPVVEDATDEGLSAYVIEATLDEATSTIAGTMDVTFENDTGQTLDEIYFRLYPNIDYYGEGALDVSAVTVDGIAAPTGLEVDDSALRIELPAPLAAGEAAAIGLAFTTTVPVNSAGSYGIFSRELGTGTWVLADWHPVLAVFEPGHGWHLDPATPAGDPTHAASSFFDVTFTAPDSLTVVASGSEVAERSANGTRTERFTAGPAREFTLVVDNDYVGQSEEVAGVTVSVYTEPDVSPEIARQTLDIAARSLTVFGELFGPYPYTELDVVQAPMDGALAVSWSGIIFLNGAAMVDRLAQSDPLSYETVVAHEIAHLWWGGTVGSNSNDHTFINEGLATLSSVIYLERTAGAETAAIAREQWMLRPAWRLLEGGDVVVDQPVSNALDESVRSSAVYGKGALGFAAIRREIGDDAFFAALHDYARANQFAIAGPAPLRAAFAAAAGRDLDALWSHWFEEAAMTAEEVASFES